MNFEDWQQLWQKQPVPAPPDAATLAATIERVRGGARAFDRTILWRDLREGLTAVGLSLVFGYTARAKALEGAPAWDAWLAAALPLGVALFLFGDRWLARRRRPRGAATVVSEIDGALAELRHQHWLLTRVTWWYLLPLAASGALLLGPAIVQAVPVWWARLALGLFGAALLGAVNYPIWRLNQRVAATELAPRIAELERLRREFADSSDAPRS